MHTMVENYPGTTPSQHYSSDIKIYYGRRAAEYDRIYQLPDRQPALRELESWISGSLAGKRILELACGTGYWTRLLAQDARQMVAVDINPEMIRIARERCQSCMEVEFHVLDVYALPETLGRFDAAFMGFWWSHIPLQDIPLFLASLHVLLDKHARVVILDNHFVYRTDADCNTYQLRKLADGSSFEVLKNFPDSGQIQSMLSGCATGFSYRANNYYWLVQYDVAE